MEPIKKKFEDYTRFPLLLNYKQTKSLQSELPVHIHEWYEIVYVYRGKGTFFIDSTFHKTQRGDVFAIPGNTIHHAIPDKDEPLTSSALFFRADLLNERSVDDAFQYLQLFQRDKENRHYKIHLPIQHHAAMENYFDGIHAELSRESLGHQSAALAFLQMMLIFLTRQVEQESYQSLPSSQAGPLWMNEILRKMDDFGLQQLSLKELSRQASVSPPHFSRVFKQMTGMNVSEYLISKKIIKAKELLLSSNDKLAVVSENCGFESIPHFYRMFKKYAGITPSAYRKKQSAGI